MQNTETEALFSAYEHLRDMPRAAEALTMLRKVASIVKPIMRKRGWKVRTLCEFYPPEANLLGLNINQTERICLRLRYPGDRTQFYPLDSVIDTLLHELSHIVHGPHGPPFQKLWNELRNEWTTLQLRGYTGEGFLGRGHKLGGGGRRVPPLHEIRRQAAEAAQKRAALNKGSGQRLGGRSVPRGVDMRRVIADSVERRNKITAGCASGNKDANKLAEDASRNGFRTKAEEDDANDRAIAAALAELYEEEEERRLMGLEQEEGLSWTKEGGLQLNNRPSSLPSPSPSQPPKSARSTPSVPPSRPSAPPTRPNRPLSRLVAEAETRTKSPRPSNNPTLPPSPAPTPAPSSDASSADDWTCDICTLHNPWNHLLCDACGVERPASTIRTRRLEARKSSTGSVTTNGSGSGSGSQTKSLGWLCSGCGAFMESQWWTCSACGKMKDRS